MFKSSGLRIFSVLLFTLISVQISANLDSLNALLSIYEADTNRVRVLDQLASQLYGRDNETAKEYALEALTCQRIGLHAGLGESLYLLTYSITTWITQMMER